VSRFVRLVRRDLAHAFSTGAALPIVFFLLVAPLFPFAVGPDLALLGKVGGGALWTAALLAALLPVERLIAPDLAAGAIDQMVVRGIGEEAIALARIIAHWLSFGPPLLLAAILAAALLGIDGPTLARLELGLLIGTPGLAALAVATAALTAGLRGAGALAGLILLPLAVPLLIFGAGALGPASAGAYKLLAATSLLLVAGAPFAAGAALRAARS
jgi:heme exporter protein B